MHAYRDAIRKNDERVVTYAAILYPGSPVTTFGTGVGAISAVPTAVSELETQIRRSLTAVLATD